MNESKKIVRSPTTELASGILVGMEECRLDPQPEQNEGLPFAPDHFQGGFHRTVVLGSRFAAAERMLDFGQGSELSRLALINAMGAVLADDDASRLVDRAL